MKSVAIFLLSVLCAITTTSSYAQEHPASISSGVPDYARYQIVQSPLAAKLTIRLDRFMGDTWQLVKATNGSYAWRPMKRIDLPNDTRLPGAVNYQIFLSAIRAEMTVLMNTNTGASWYIDVDRNGGEFWSPVK